MLYLFLFDSNSGYTNAPQYYAIRTLPVLSSLFMIFQRGFLFRWQGDNREYLNIPEWHAIAVGSTGSHNAGTMWHFSDAGVTCSGKLLVTVTGLEKDSCEKRKWRNILCTWSLKINQHSVQRYVDPARAFYINNLY